MVTADSRYYSYYVGYTSDVVSSFRPEGDYSGEKGVRHTLSISDSKDTHIIFPANLKYVDYGDGTVKVTKADGVENIIKVKALKPFCELTNLSAITEQGKFYTFNLGYDKEVEVISYLVDKNDTRRGQVAILDNREMNVLQKDSLRRQIEHLPARMNLESTNGKVDFAIRNIMVKDGTLFIKMCMTNNSQINYTIDFIRFYIQDAKKTKKTALQQLELTPLFYFNYQTEIRYHQSHVFTAALEKFTIPDKKICIIEIQESGGGRHFFFKLHNRHLLDAQVLLEHADDVPDEEAELGQSLRASHFETSHRPEDGGSPIEDREKIGQKPAVAKGDQTRTSPPSRQQGTPVIKEQETQKTMTEAASEGSIQRQSQTYQQQLKERKHVAIPPDEKVNNNGINFNYFDYIDRPVKKDKKKKKKSRL